jgi:hypothetical protein
MREPIWPGVTFPTDVYAVVSAKAETMTTASGIWVRACAGDDNILISDD